MLDAGLEVHPPPTTHPPTQPPATDRLVIVDWNAHSSGTGKDSWFQSDRIHLTGTGQAEMALLIRDHVIQNLQAS